VTLQRTLLFLSILFTCLIGCNEDPSIVGIGVLPKSDFSAPQTDTIYATRHATEYEVLNTGYVDRVMLGNTADCEALTLIKFYSWPDSMVGAYITSATISLKTMYHFGDATGTLSFDLYNAKRDWTGDSLAVNDSLFNATTSSNYYDHSTFMGSATITSNDDTSWVSFEIPTDQIPTDTAIMTKWFLSSSDTNGNNYGLILKPTNNNMIKGFYSFNASDTVSVYPILTVQYININGDTGTYSHSIGVTKYLAHANQPLHDKIFKTDTMMSFVQNGISYRSTFYFDTLRTLKKMLIPSTVLVHNAYIEVTSNPNSFLNNLNLSDSLYAYIALTDSTLYSSSIVLSETSINQQTQQHKYRFKVNSFVQAWLKSPSMIKKIAIAGYNESLTFDRFALYGNNATESERPRLIITYSMSK
jgi:hypothetical protein